jgi:hypothetical protein
MASNRPLTMMPARAVTVCRRAAARPPRFAYVTHGTAAPRSQASRGGGGASLGWAWAARRAASLTDTVREPICLLHAVRREQQHPPERMSVERLSVERGDCLLSGAIVS